MLALLAEAFTREELPNGEERIVLKLKPQLAPIKAAVIPLVKNRPEITGYAKALKARLQALGLGRILYEDTGNIGKAYRRHDEVGTPSPSPWTTTPSARARTGPQGSRTR